MVFFITHWGVRCSSFFSRQFKPHGVIFNPIGSDATDTAYDADLHHASLPLSAFEEHTACILSAHSWSIQQGATPNGMNDPHPPSFNHVQDTAIPEMSSTWFGTGFGSDIPDVPADFLGYHDVTSVISPSTTFTAGPPSLAPPHVRAVPPSGPSHATTAHPPQSVSTSGRLRFVCDYPGCTKSYTRHPDMRRHALSHNAAAPTWFCHHTGCRRGFRGFLRKDKLTAHLKAVHGA